MISWWMWVLLWTVLVLAALAFLGWQAYRVFRQGLALVQELGETAERAAEIAETAEELPTERRDWTPAIFADPVQIQAERVMARRAKRARIEERRASREASQA